jgi:hypothetical protein
MDSDGIVLVVKGGFFSWVCVCEERWRGSVVGE